MPDQLTPGAGPPAAPVVTPPAPAAGASGVTPAVPPIEPQDPPVIPDPPVTPEAETLQEWIKERKALRREAAKYRTKAKALEDAEAERARSAMSEAEKTAADLTAAQGKIADLETRLSTQALQAKIQEIAADKVQPGALSIIVNLLDLDSLGDDEIGPAIDAILETKPFLAKETQRGGPITPTNPAGGQNLETDAQKRARLLHGRRQVKIFGPGPSS